MVYIKWNSCTIYKITSERKWLNEIYNMRSNRKYIEETWKNSSINMLSIHYSLDVKKRQQSRPKLLYPEYIVMLINNEIQPIIVELRKIAVERTKWSKYVFVCKPRLLSAE